MTEQIEESDNDTNVENDLNVNRNLRDRDTLRKPQKFEHFVMTAVNEVTQKYKEPIQVSRLSGKFYFTTLDLAQGYYQVPIDEECIGKTAFVTPLK